MSKTKKALIAAAIFGIIGFVGSIATGISAVPRLINDVKNEVNAIRGVEIKKFSANEKDVNGINIVIKDNLTPNEIKFVESKDGNFNIKCSDYDLANIIDIKVNSDTKVMEIVRDNIEDNNKKQSDFTWDINGILRYFAGKDMTRNDLVIEIPRKVDIKVDSKNTSTYINIKGDNIIGENIELNMPSGVVKILGENTIKKLNINGNAEVNISLASLQGADEVYIRANTISIESYGMLNKYSLNNIPKKADLVASSVSIHSFIPIAVDTNITSTESAGAILPFDEYNINGKVELREDSMEEIYSDNMPVDFSNKKSYSGKLSSKKDGKEFNLNIKSNVGMYFYNNNSIDIENTLMQQHN